MTEKIETELIQFDAETRERVRREFRDDAIRRRENTRKEILAVEERLAELGVTQELVEGQLKEIIAESDKLHMELVGLKAQDAALKNSLSDWE